MWTPVEPITLLTPATKGSGRGRGFTYRLCGRGAALSGQGGEHGCVIIRQSRSGTFSGAWEAGAALQRTLTCTLMCTLTCTRASCQKPGISRIGCLASFCLSSPRFRCHILSLLQFLFYFHIHTHSSDHRVPHKSLRNPDANLFPLFLQPS